MSSLGKMGEDYTAEHLRKNGYKILSRNFHSRFGEIDIIASKDKYIVFVEVKARSVKAIASPFEFVTKSKQNKIILTAKYYLLSHRAQLQPRFDVAGLIYEGSNVLKFDYLENAFICG